MGKIISRRVFLRNSALALGAVATAYSKGVAYVFAASKERAMSGRVVTEVFKISVEANGRITVFELNDSQASRDLYDQLPLSIAVEDYASNEKIFYPPKKLGTADTPLAKNVQPGTLAYYAPWGDVVMFYEKFGSAAGLYELGHAVSGIEHIRGMSGTIEIEKVSTQ